jgi:AraC-like DNA-binding protein
MDRVDPNGKWWTTIDLRPGEKLEAWEAALAECIPAFEVRSVCRRFDAMVRRRALGAMSLFECVADPCRGRRPPHLIRRDGEPYVGVQIILSGVKHYRVGDDAITVRGGDLVIWNSAQPTEFEIAQRVHQATVYLPSSELLERLPSGTVLLGCQLEAARGIGAVLYAHIQALVAQFAYLGSIDAHAVKRATLELVAGAAVDRLRLAPTSLSAQHLQRLQRYILEHIHDAGLSPAQIAQANGLSTRYLHLLFEATGETVSSWLQRQRLEHCRDALTNDAFATRNIAEVAHYFGFKDSSHFSRVFKQRYGQTPRGYRVRAGAGTFA